MKFLSIDRRLKAIEPEPVDLEELKRLENDRLLVQAFEGHFLKHLQELGCSEVLDKVRAALQTVGPRPFGHTKADDRPMWIALDDAKRGHDDLAYRFRAAELLAWADVYIDLGESEDSKYVKQYRGLAARDLEWEKRNKQTFCDNCGGDLSSWSCYDGNMQKLCRTCAGYPA